MAGRAHGRNLIPPIPPAKRAADKITLSKMANALYAVIAMLVTGSCGMKGLRPPIESMINWLINPNPPHSSPSEPKTIARIDMTVMEPGLEPCAA
jgi:hypothetical protein